MESETLVAFVALIVSCCAFAASSAISVRQLRSMRAASNLPVAIDRLEGLEIGLRQWIFETLSRTAERIVRQHRNNDADIITARATNGDL